jgi:CheY-like chemotaxis protein
MTEIKFDKRNYRIHNQKNKDLIKQSLEKYGAGRSILVDSEGEIIAGNGVYEQAKALNIPIREVETDGSELVVVVRKDLKTEDQARKELAVMDNSTSDSSENNIELLEMDFEMPKLEELGIEVVKKIEETTDFSDNSKYTRKVTIPVYEIKGEKPQISQMINTERAERLIGKIERSSLAKEKKEFLKKAATRLYEFRYDFIAEYYAHADKEEQEIMEDLALVIIDFEKAIEEGYVELNKFIESVFLKENGLEDE